jgi:hypothetical protein
MANQVVARLLGDDYQHLFSWHQVLELLRPATTVESVRLEDEDAMSVDDVTVHHAGGRTQYFQVKCHVDHRSGYSEGSLLEADGKKSSLLQKWYRSYRKIRDQRGGACPEIYLVSNWGWMQGDVLPGFVCGVRETIDDGFFSEGVRSKAGKLRARLREHLNVDDRELEEFLKCVRFRIAFGSLSDLADRVSERMHHLGLKRDEASLHVAAGAVRTWIKDGPVDLTADLVRARITELGLWLPAASPATVHVHLLTIKDQRFEVEPDYRIDWRDHFVGPAACRGHEVVAPDIWNSHLMPDLLALEQKINHGTSIRNLRAFGKARLSAWTAFGFVFSQVNGYTLEVDQNGNMWNTAAPISTDFRLLPTNENSEWVMDEGDAVAVGISVSGLLESDVRQDLSKHVRGVRAFLHLQPNRELGATSLRDASDALTLARQAKALMRDFAKRYEARQLFLYYFGPLGGAAFIGHQLNAVCPRVQLMEHTGVPGDGYAPSFLLE